MPNPAFWGQWRGYITGTNAGHVAVNIDVDRPDDALVQFDDNQYGPEIASVRLTRISPTHLMGKIIPGDPLAIPQPGVRRPTSGLVEIDQTLDNRTLTGTWKTDAETKGGFHVFSVEPEEPLSWPATETMSWGKFKQWALEKSSAPGWVFRGQDTATNPLMSLFHRAKRRDLSRYRDQDVPRLRQAIEAVLGTSFPLEQPYDYGNLLNLAQHHGFPTPLLDFTFSPFVAAYFAFSTVGSRKATPEVPVRIYALSPRWGSKRSSHILEVRPVMTFMELGARMNPRVLPQQSVNMFTNVPDVEGLIRLKEMEASNAEGVIPAKEMDVRPGLLERIDLPASDATVALKELRTFGISASSLFPGVEGACRGLAEAYFS